MGLLNNLLRAAGIEDQHETFERTMKDIARHLGLPATLCGDEHGAVCGMLVTFGDSTYHFFVTNVEDNVQFRVHSLINFPPDRLPEEVNKFLNRRNQTLPHFDWCAQDELERSRYYLKGETHWRHICAGLVEDAIKKMVKEVATLDDALIEAGYVR